MPIRSKRERICERCGSKFTIETGDAITISDLKKLSEQYCVKCRILRKLGLAKER